MSRRCLSCGFSGTFEPVETASFPGRMFSAECGPFLPFRSVEKPVFLRRDTEKECNFSPLVNRCLSGVVSGAKRASQLPTFSRAVKMTPFDDIVVRVPRLLYEQALRELRNEREHNAELRFELQTLRATIQRYTVGGVAEQQGLDRVAYLEKEKSRKNVASVHLLYSSANSIY